MALNINQMSRCVSVQGVHGRSTDSANSAPLSCPSPAQRAQRRRRTWYTCRQSRSGQGSTTQHAQEGNRHVIASHVIRSQRLHCRQENHYASTPALSGVERTSNKVLRRACPGSLAGCAGPTWARPADCARRAPPPPPAPWGLGHCGWRSPTAVCLGNQAPHKGTRARAACVLVKRACVSGTLMKGSPFIGSGIVLDLAGRCQLPSTARQHMIQKTNALPAQIQVLHPGSISAYIALVVSVHGRAHCHATMTHIAGKVSRLCSPKLNACAGLAPENFVGSELHQELSARCKLCACRLPRRAASIMTVSRSHCISTVTAPSPFTAS